MNEAQNKAEEKAWKQYQKDDSVKNRIQKDLSYCFHDWKNGRDAALREAEKEDLQECGCPECKKHLRGSV